MMNMMDGEDRGKRERASEDISDENKASGEIKGRDDTGTAITSALHGDEKEGKKSKKQKMNKSALTWDDIFPSRAQGPFSNDNNDGSKTSIREQDVKRYQQDDVHDNDNALKDKQNELIYNNKTTTIGNDDNQELTSMDTNHKDRGDKIDVVADDVDAHKMGNEAIEENDNDNDGSNTKGFAVGGANNAQLSEPSKPKELDGEDQDSHGHNGNIDDGYENGDEEEDDDDGDDDDIDDDDGKKSDSKNGQSLWTLAEDKLILELQKKLGNKWVEMCPFLPGRTKNQIKTRFRSLSRASKRLWTKEEDQMLIDLRSRTKLNDWGKIAEHFPGRTKNAVKVRFRELMDSKLGDIPPPAPGSPRQALIGRDEKVPSYTGSGRRENKLEQILKGSKQNHQQQNEPELGRLKVSGISSSNSSSNNSVSSGSGNSHGRASSSNSNNEHHGNNHGDMRKHEVVQSPSKSDKSLSPALITPNIPILQTGNTNNMFMSPMQHFQSFLQYQQHQNGTTSTTGGGAPTGAATATNAFAYGNGQMQGMPMLGLMPGSNMPVMMLMVPMPSSNGSNNTMFNVSMMGNHINSNNNNNSIAQQQQQQQQQQMMMMSTLMKDNNSSNSNLYHQEPNAISNNVNNNKTI